MFFRGGAIDPGMVTPHGPSARKRWQRWLLVLVLLLVGLPVLGWFGARQLGVVPPAGVMAGIVFNQLTGKETAFPGGGLGLTGAGAVPGAGTAPVPGNARTAPLGSAAGAGALDPQKLLAGNPASTAGKSALQRRIEAKYIVRMQSVAGSFQGRLNALMGSAWNEYVSAQKQGKKVPVMALAGKYIPAGNAMEAQCDAQFYAILDQFKAELKRNNLPLDTAIQAQQAYEQSKAARKRQILSRALGL